MNPPSTCPSATPNGGTRSARSPPSAQSGTPYDAAAESLIGLFKTELIRRRGPWRGPDHVQLAALEWADWFDNRWLYSAYGNVPPVEYEQQHDRHIAALETFETAESSLH
jgi:putative transposase